jgi:hypothetical protein
LSLPVSLLMPTPWGLSQKEEVNEMQLILETRRRASRVATELMSSCGCISSCANRTPLELELELIRTQLTQKPMLRAEVYARALRASQSRKEISV